jgi:hypothetical protein
MKRKKRMKGITIFPEALDVVARWEGYPVWIGISPWS